MSATTKRHPAMMTTPLSLQQMNVLLRRAGLPVQRTVEDAKEMLEGAFAEQYPEGFQW
jgi:hypothetical protein